MFVPYATPFSQQIVPFHPTNGLYHSGISPIPGYPPGIGISPMSPGYSPMSPGYYGYRAGPMIPYGYGYGYGGYGLAHAGVEGGFPGGGQQGWNVVGSPGWGAWGGWPQGWGGWGSPLQPAWSGGVGSPGQPS